MNEGDIHCGVGADNHGCSLHLTFTSSSWRGRASHLIMVAHFN